MVYLFIQYGTRKKIRKKPHEMEIATVSVRFSNMYMQYKYSYCTEAETLIRAGG